LLCVNKDARGETVGNRIVSWSYVVSYAGAEKGDEGMALKIRTRGEDMPDGKETLKIMPMQKEKEL
jgi:hypothetical protein